jgi:hypothetical protein
MQSTASAQTLPQLTTRYSEQWRGCWRRSRRRGRWTAIARPLDSATWSKFLPSVLLLFRFRQCI